MRTIIPVALLLGVALIMVRPHTARKNLPEERKSLAIFFMDGCFDDYIVSLQDEFRHRDGQSQTSTIPLLPSAASPQFKAFAKSRFTVRCTGYPVNMLNL